MARAIDRLSPADLNGRPLLFLGLVVGHFVATWSQVTAAAAEQRSTVNIVILFEKGGACELQVVKRMEEFRIPLRAYVADFEDMGFDEIDAEDTIDGAAVSRSIKGRAIDIFPVLRFLHGSRPMFASRKKLAVNWDGELLSVSLKESAEILALRSEQGPLLEDGRLTIKTSGHFISNSVGEMDESRQKIEIDSIAHVADLSFAIDGLLGVAEEVPNSSSR